MCPYISAQAQEPLMGGCGMVTLVMLPTTVPIPQCSAVKLEEAAPVQLGLCFSVLTATGGNRGGRPRAIKATQIQATKLHLQLHGLICN